MKSKVNEAGECFNSGFNCAQAILSTYCEQFGLDKETALKLSCGLGAGMGRLGEVCGAVSGAYLLIGLKNGNSTAEDRASKENTYTFIQEFDQQFRARNKSTICRELLEVDLLTEDMGFATEQVKRICPQMVRDAAEIIESIL